MLFFKFHLKVKAVFILELEGEVNANCQLLCYMHTVALEGDEANQQRQEHLAQLLHTFNQHHRYFLFKLALGITIQLFPEASGQIASLRVSIRHKKAVTFQDADELVDISP